MSARDLDPWHARPEDVAQWVSDLAAAYKPSSIGRKVAALAALYKMAGRPSPTRDDRVRVVLAGIRRAHAAPAKQAAPLTGDLLRQLVAGLDAERVADVRDCAVLLLGFAAALRRSELVALDVVDLEFVASRTWGSRPRRPAGRRRLSRARRHPGPRGRVRGRGNPPPGPAVRAAPSLGAGLSRL